MQTQASELLSDIQLAIDYLKNLPQVKKDSFGCIGFCFGGHVAYLAATLPDIKATASFTVLELPPARQEVALPLLPAPEKFQALSMPSLVQKMLASHPNK